LKGLTASVMLWWIEGSRLPGEGDALKHGFYTREAITRRRYIRELMRESRKTIEALS
jgi:hypothetical protein